MLNTIRRIKRRLKRIGLHYHVSKRDNVRVIGSEYGGFAVCVDFINQDSIVYSFGLGEDISFDLGMIENFGCCVKGFDPTPRSIEWLNKQALPPNFSYEAIGLADYDGDLTFAMPEEKSWISISSVLEQYENTDRIVLPVNRLSTIMRNHKNDRIDVLKMDIEGTEYAVIDDFLSEHIYPPQIVLEFHHLFKGVGYEKTNRAIRLLNEAGYELFYISDIGLEMSFLRVK